MRTAALTVGATVLLTATVAVSAEAISTHPSAHHRHVAAAAAPSALDHAITVLKPYVYWPLNSGTSPEADGSGNSRPGLTVAGSGASVQLASPTNPAGGSGGSVAFTPSGQQGGQYLRSALRPIPAKTAGTVVVWFKLNRALPGWWQTLVVDNGATTGYGGGFFINDTGRLVITDSTGTYYDQPANFGPRRHTETGPLNDGRWHMLAFVEQYNIDTGGGAPSTWLPSLLYFDGQLVDKALEGRFLDVWGGSGKSRILLGAGQTSQAAALGKFSGNLADVALFDRLLTANQISGIWQAGN